MDGIKQKEEMFKHIPNMGLSTTNPNALLLMPKKWTSIETCDHTHEVPYIECGLGSLT